MITRVQRVVAENERRGAEQRQHDEARRPAPEPVEPVLLEPRGGGNGGGRGRVVLGLPAFEDGLAEIGRSAHDGHRQNLALVLKRPCGRTSASGCRATKPTASRYCRPTKPATKLSTIPSSQPGEQRAAHVAHAAHDDDREGLERDRLAHAAVDGDVDGRGEHARQRGERGAEHEGRDARPSRRRCRPRGSTRCSATRRASPCPCACGAPSARARAKTASEAATISTMRCCARTSGPISTGSI